MHFTFSVDCNFHEFIKDFECYLLPFQPRPHWGKLHTSKHNFLQNYPSQHLTNLKKMQKVHDPSGKFMNNFLHERLCS